MTMTLVAPTVADYEASADLATLVVRTRRMTWSDIDRRAAPSLLQMRSLHTRPLRRTLPRALSRASPITEIGDLGYGLNISFSDGHNRGIYPKPYLLSLAGR